MSSPLVTIAVKSPAGVEGVEVQNPLDAEMMKGRPDWSLAGDGPWRRVTLWSERAAANHT